MSDEFKRKLAAYEKGELSDAELDAFEQELEKLEMYQEHLEENESPGSNGSKINEKKQQKILKRSKWKARLQTAFFAITMILALTIVSSILTSVYYSWGTPDRVDVFRNVIDHTLTITDPHQTFGGTSTNTTPFFGLKATRDLQKNVGHETVKVGEMEVNFLFSMMSHPEREYSGERTQNRAVFAYPDGEFDLDSASEWNKLDKLPEGTVVSAYVSFEELLETEDVFERFENMEMDLTWLAVDTGVEATEEWNQGIVDNPIGFPSFPIWHEDDMILDSREQEQGLFGSRTVSETRSSPDYTVGEGEVLHEQFMKTLFFLEDHETKANNLVSGGLKLSERISYLENNGFFHYGAVITGPTKEVLTLQEEAWVEALQVDEVSLWNWNEYD
ncbi:anti-sigma factor [Salipaludibacillus daqingensis]|uniref:anti-sigma factor n=1 Tax=Salipaludibacillus daqingensis TaxID=3041001 RepID=UPI0024758772|nr:anti-sigma factor [Salipaludibacillus daqingensis]